MKTIKQVTTVESAAKKKVTVNKDDATGRIIREDDFFDYRGLSGYLNVSVGTLRNWKSAGRLSYCTIGGKVLFPRRDIERMLCRATVKATEVVFKELKKNKH